MKLSNATLLVCGVGAVALVLASQAAIPSVYHGLYTLQDTVIGATGFILFCCTIAFVLAKITIFNNALLRLFLIVFFYRTVYTLVKPHLSDGPMPLWLKGVIAFTFLLFLLWLLLRVKVDGWRQLSKFIIVSCLIFAFSPLIVAQVQKPQSSRNFSFSKVKVDTVKNYVILVMDETSPEYAKNFIKILEGAELFVEYQEMISAGENTLNAIPSMLSKSRHDDVSPCSSSAICGPQSFDFSQIEAVQDNVDIVGFWQPYCSIKNLRSCFRYEGTFSASTPSGFGLYGLWCTQFNRFRLFSFCDSGGMKVADLNNAKLTLSERIYQAPFWQDGGILYVHYPLPHPSMTANFASLKVEYELNIIESEQFIMQLTSRLISRFGSNFALVITSDHALRPSVWCKRPGYENPDCLASMPANRGYVPFILASPKPINIKLPHTNVGIFSP